MNFEGANLERATINGNLQYVNLNHANLTNARLGGTFDNVSFTGANLQGVDLINKTDLRGAKNLNLPWRKIKQAEHYGCKFGPWTKLKARIRG